MAVIDFQAIVQEFVANRDFATNNDVAKAKAYLAACRGMLVVPEEIYRQHERLRGRSGQFFSEEIERVQEWLNAKSMGKGVASSAYLGFTGYRD